MKKIKLLIGIAAVLLAMMTLKTEAQTFYGITVVSNSTSAPVMKAFQQQFATAQLYFPAQTLLITNINTNQTYYLSYGTQPTGVSTTNLVQLGSIVTNFNASQGFTNGGNAIIPIPFTQLTVSNAMWGTFSNSSFVSPGWTNGVSLQ